MDVVTLLSDFSLVLLEKKQNGAKIAAFLAHDNIPEEMLDACGIIPLRMMFGGNEELMNASHDYLPPSTCAFTQSSIGLFSLKPSKYQFLDLVDYFLVSNHCVSDICGSEIITKYFNIPRLNFYVSYTKNENSEKYFRLELEDFKRQLEDITKSKLTDDKLYESIKKFNKFKQKLQELNSLNLIGSKKLHIIQEAMLFGPSYYDKLTDFIENNREKQIRQADTLKNVILTGCSVFINDYLVDLIEDAGGNVCFFDTWIGNHYYSQVFSKDELNSNLSPFDLLVQRYKKNILSDHSVPNFLDNKIAQLVKINNSYKKKTGKNVGVINHIIKFCDHFSMLSSYFKEKLQVEGIRVLNLERDYSGANKGQLSTRIEAYLEMLEL
ncbi:MAG: 2-hydroxyacyl-CoA dehydratase family protein [Candidatus Lokiarchaeota archaeon]|nr:2-hydroxyacyl-CoA dehydratase family protein [Candidatus Lokiarchaeota archaeon]